MKKYILIAALVLMTVLIVVQQIRINKLTDKAQLQAVELATLNGEVDVYKARTGELSYKLASVSIEKGNLKKSLDLAGFNIKKLKEQDIKWRKLTNALKLELETTGSVTTTVIDTFYVEDTDTVYYSTFNEWSNNYLSIYNGKIIDNKLTFDYNYKVDIQLLQEHKKKEIIVTAILTDPKAKITSANSITITKEKKWWKQWWFWGAAGLTSGILIAK